MLEINHTEYRFTAKKKYLYLLEFIEYLDIIMSKNVSKIKKNLSNILLFFKCFIFKDTSVNDETKSMQIFQFSWDKYLIIENCVIISSIIHALNYLRYVINYTITMTT